VAETLTLGRRESGAPAIRAVGRHPWTFGTGLLVLVSIAVVRIANGRPGFDPYGWLTWGQQTLKLTLNTNAAPSWKPLAYVFTVPYALFGHFQLWLWMTTNLITQASPQYSIWHYILSDQSDPMIVALCLGAIDCHLSGRQRWALWLGVLAGLGRPEVWALLGPYGVWLWLRRPELRWMLVAAVVVMAAMWFGIPAISSRSPFVSADNAFYSGRRLTHNQIFGTIGRFLDLMPRGLELTALASVALAGWRRDRVTLALAGAVVVWMVIEIAMVLHGWPGVPRYMFEPAGLLAVIAGIGIGRLLAAPPRLDRPAGLAAVAVAAAAVISVVPVAVSDARAEHRDLDQQRLRTRTLNLLGTEIAGYGGGARFRACGEPLTRLQYQSSVAWELGVNVANVGFKYGPAIDSRRPIVLFTPYPQAGSGWRISAYRQRATAFCRSLPTG